VKKTNLTFVLILLILTTSMIYLDQSFEIKKTAANPIPVGPPPSLWQLVGFCHTNSSVNISIIDSNVLLDIDYTKYLKFKIATYGEYIFYNFNETTTITVLAPFDLYDSSIREFSLEVDNNLVPFTVYDLTNEQRLQLIYLTNGPISPSVSVLAANITFEGFKNTTVKYYVSTDFKRNKSGSYTSIGYLVSSGKIWFGNITEKVEFRVKGLQPDYYSESDTKHCSIVDFSGGKSYNWEWKNEVMDFHFLYIEFRSKDTRLIVKVIVPLIVVILITMSLLIVFYLRKRTKIRKTIV